MAPWDRNEDGLLRHGSPEPPNLFNLFVTFIHTAGKEDVGLILLFLGNQSLGCLYPTCLEVDDRLRAVELHLVFEAIQHSHPRLDPEDLFVSFLYFAKEATVGIMLSFLGGRGLGRIERTSFAVRKRLNAHHLHMATITSEVDRHT